MRGSDRSLRAWLAIAFLLLAPVAASAADSDDVARLKELLRSTTVALRAAQDENAALTASQTQLNAQVADLKRQVGDLQAKSGAAAALQQQLEETGNTSKQAQAQLAEARGLLDKWQASYKEAAEAANTRGAVLKRDEQKLRMLESGLGQCSARNAKLVSIATEVLDKFVHQSVAQCLARDDHVTGLYRVKLENMAQDTQDRIDDQRIHARGP